MPKTTVFGGKEVDFVEVHEEPLHRRQFSNDYCWVYIAGIGPGETSLWHRHSANTFYVCVQHACAALNRPSDKVQSSHTSLPEHSCRCKQLAEHDPWAMWSAGMLHNVTWPLRGRRKRWWPDSAKGRACLCCSVPRWYRKQSSAQRRSCWLPRADSCDTWKHRTRNGHAGSPGASAAYPRFKFRSLSFQVFCASST